jgi:hypothetical protein
MDVPRSSYYAAPAAQPEDPVLVEIEAITEAWPWLTAIAVSAPSSATGAMWSMPRRSDA